MIRPGGYRVEADPALHQDPAAEVGPVNRDVVNIDLQTQRADMRAVQGQGSPGTADRADVLRADLPDQLPIEKFGHQVGDRGPVQAGRLRDVGPGLGHVVAQVA